MRKKILPLIEVCALLSMLVLSIFAGCIGQPDGTYEETPEDTPEVTPSDTPEETPQEPPESDTPEETESPPPQPSPTPQPDTAIIADHTIISHYESLSSSTISAIQDLHIYYVHTSHGSQIMTGLHMLPHSLPYFHEVDSDLGHDGDTFWEEPARRYLDNHPDCNVVMMSWCGGCSDNTRQGINTYLNTFNQLEQDYPNVIFIYMTGHLDGTGINGNLYARNNQIRDFCYKNNKILFDFADIESYDPDGNFYPDEDDSCNWCETWCQTHDCLSCRGCAHSHCFNCYLKGKAWWCMMAEVVEQHKPFISDGNPQFLSRMPLITSIVKYGLLNTHSDSWSFRFAWIETFGLKYPL
ncbi:MAG: hypothetical protein PVF58_06845 [Candidatus Methanofastidiosia archaeon]|jgi:hypothetical protein